MGIMDAYEQLRSDAQVSVVRCSASSLVKGSEGFLQRKAHNWWSILAGCKILILHLVNDINGSCLANTTAIIPHKKNISGGIILQKVSSHHYSFSSAY